MLSSSTPVRRFFLVLRVHWSRPADHFHLLALQHHRQLRKLGLPFPVLRIRRSASRRFLLLFVVLAVGQRVVRSSDSQVLHPRSQPVNPGITLVPAAHAACRQIYTHARSVNASGSYLR